MHSPGIMILPKTSRLPAFVAGFLRVLMMHSPGIMILPTFLTCSVATSAKELITFITSDFLTSVSAANASARPDFEIAFAPDFMVFFIGAIATGPGGAFGG